MSLFIQFEDGDNIILSKPNDGEFMQCYQERLYVSDRCTSCQFKGDSIAADIIIGDGWGLNPVAESMEDGNGLSCILIMSNRGSQMWNEIKDCFTYKETETEIIATGNKRLIYPSKPNPRSNRFYKEVHKKGYVDSELLKKYMYKNTILAKAKKVARKFIKRT